MPGFDLLHHIYEKAFLVWEGLAVFSKKYKNTLRKFSIINLKYLKLFWYVRQTSVFRTSCNQFCDELNTKLFSLSGNLYNGVVNL